jgi:hypothetical protein
MYIYYGLAPVAKQPQQGMLYNYYDNQNLYAVVNQATFASPALETDRTILVGDSTTLPLATRM